MNGEVSFKCLTENLKFNLSMCEKLRKYDGAAQTQYDQSFGMVLMFVTIFPDMAEQAEKLWDEYRPKFAEYRWG